MKSGLACLWTALTLSACHLPAASDSSGVTGNPSKFSHSVFGVELAQKGISLAQKSKDRVLSALLGSLPEESRCQALGCNPPPPPPSPTPTILPGCLTHGSCDQRSETPEVRVVSRCDPRKSCQDGSEFEIDESSELYIISVNPYSSLSLHGKGSFEIARLHAIGGLSGLRLVGHGQNGFVVLVQGERVVLLGSAKGQRLIPIRFERP